MSIALKAALLARPQSLDEVARRVSAGESLTPGLREFIDEFQLADANMRPDMLAQEPMWIEPLADAYFAAYADYLSEVMRFDPPRWCLDPRRSLARPYFAGGLEDLKAILLAQSPTAFRARNIFVDEGPLSRPAKRLDLG